MATVAGRGKRPRRRLPLTDLTNLSSSTSTSRLTRLKATAQSKACTSPSASSSIGSSTAPRTRFPPPPPVVAEVKVKVKDKTIRELQSSSFHLKKIKKISEPKVKTGDMLPGASSTPSKKARKRTKNEQPHMEPLERRFADSLPSQNFVKEQRAYFAEIDAFELVEEFISSGSDLE